MWCFWVGLWGGKTPLLILQKRWQSFRFPVDILRVCLSFTMAAKVLNMRIAGFQGTLLSSRYVVY